MTLVEMLISMSILTMAGGIVLGMVVSAKKMWQASVSRVAISQDLQVASLRIVQDLRQANAGVITDNTTGTPVAFSFLSAHNGQGTFQTDPSGKPLWQKEVIYYLPTGTKRLLRKEVAGTFSSALTQAELVGYCDGRGSLCASTVSSLRLVTNGSDHSAALTLACQATNGQGHLDSQGRTVTILMRN